MTGLPPTSDPAGPAFHPASPDLFTSARDPRKLLDQALKTWGGNHDLWVFGYASLIWRPEFEFSESRLARVHGWHRALKMWSRVNRGTPEVPGLVFALLSGGSCRGVTYRVPREQAAEVLARMWLREMVTDVYDPRWLPCQTTAGPVRALAFTLSRQSPGYTGPMSIAQYRAIFKRASGRFGTTLDYVEATGRTLRDHGIHDRTLHRLLRDYGAMDPAERSNATAGAALTVRHAAAADAAMSAAATLKPIGDSEAAGTTAFTQENGAVQVEATVTGLAPNSERGFHIHEKGSCDNNGNAAGGHFAPRGHPHGAPGLASHAGDMPMLKADADGKAVVSFKTSDVTVAPGPDSVVGRAVIVHKDKDNPTTQPTGNSGPRIACGVIEAK